MKSPSPTTWLLVLNLGLIAVIASLVKLRQAPERSSPDGEEAPGSARAQARAAQAARQAAAVPIYRTNTFHWAQLESEDYRTYIERLRAVGCPEQTIRDLIIADIDKLMAPRLHAIEGLTNALRYWQADDREFESERLRRQRRAQQREVDFQKRSAIRELLGADLVSEREASRGDPDHSGRRLGFLPEEKRARVRDVIERFNDAETAIREKLWLEGQPLSPEDQTRLRELQAGREAAIAGLLSPEEQNQYDLALSPTAYAVRDQLFGMNATEPEFLTLFKLQKEFDQQWPNGLADPSDPAALQRHGRDQETLQTRIREQLGDARYAEYQRAQDADYRQLRVTIAQHQTSPAAANEVYDMKQEVARSQSQVMLNETLTLERKREILAAMSEETARSVRTALGEAAYRDYLRSGGGAWMRPPGAPAP